MDMRKPQGQYRTEPPQGRSPMVYVVGGGTPAYLTEATYRARGYEPQFEKLPTEDQYDT